MNSGNAIKANTIDGCSGEADIADYWKNHFSKLLNVNSYDATLKTSLRLFIVDMIIPSTLISEAMKKLECGKSAGPDSVYAESIKFAHPRLHVLLSICFKFMFHTWVYACRYDGNYNGTNH